VFSRSLSFGKCLFLLSRVFWISFLCVSGLSDIFMLNEYVWAEPCVLYIYYSVNKQKEERKI
jgi:hypothetical protein